MKSQKKEIKREEIPGMIEEAEKAIFKFNENITGIQEACNRYGLSVPTIMVDAAHLYIQKMQGNVTLAERKIKNLKAVMARPQKIYW